MEIHWKATWTTAVTERFPTAAKPAKQASTSSVSRHRKADPILGAKIVACTILAPK
jgi:hypothetical protein